MFSSTNGTPAAGSVRTSRRRQRTSQDDSMSQIPKAKRQRSKLEQDSFIPPTEMKEAAKFSVAILPRDSAIIERREIAVRGKKSKSGDRGAIGDGSVILTRNDMFSVAKLPALPDPLRTNVTGRQHGAIYSDSGYALTLTHAQAFVWPYAENIHSPEAFTFPLPHPSKHTSDALPLGCLVSPSASSSEPGLVVVIPTSGKITYWESVATAATLDFIHQQRHGVEYTIQGLGSGETVIQVLNAESAGFVLAFSTGRIAYMSVRDGQGRPAVSVQFLRGGSGAASGGIFGSIRNALSISSLRGDIAAVRAGRPDKVGERNVVVATANGKLQSWNLHRGGHNSLQAETDARDSIVVAIKQAQPALSNLPLESFEVLDFTYAPKSVSNTQLTGQDEAGTHLLLLISMTDRHKAHYSLVEVVLKRNELLIGRIRPMKSYTTPVSKIAIAKPRLYLPNPALVAYAVFDRAVVILSMARQPDSPDSQLQMESHILPQAFEDVIDFREDMSVEIVGSGMEEPHGLLHGSDEPKSPRFNAKHPATVLIIRGGGVVRVAATNVSKLASNKVQQITAKSKLEQAVFFGTMDKNPISFAVRPELQFSPEEIGAAALELSLEILKSQTPYIPAVPASIAENLRKRSSALRELAGHLKATNVDLARATRWQLLAHAERMAAASVIWKNYDAGLRMKPDGEKRGVLADIVDFIHEDYKSAPVAEAGELDRVRHWFINDIHELETALPWGYQVIRETFGSGQKDHGYVMQILAEADELIIGALEGAFTFRTANLQLYGLQDEELEYGVLKDGFEGLPEFWTSTLHVVNNVRKQTELASVLLKEYYGKAPKPNIGTALIDKIRLKLGTVVDLSIRSTNERIRWDTAQNTPELQIEAENIKKLQTAAEDSRISMLASELELGDEALEIAKKHEIMPTLASVLALELNECNLGMRFDKLDPDAFEGWRERFQGLKALLDELFDKFGDRWATALYEHFVETRAMQELLNDHQHHQKILTAFLRSKPEYAKIAWLQEVIREQNFKLAAESLLDLGLKREQDVWSKNIELSIGKMARLASIRDYSQADELPDIAAVNNELELIKIQDQVYKHVLPSIDAALDEKAEVQLAMESYGNQTLRTKSAFSSLLDQSMSRLLKHESMDVLSLIDLLSLMGDAGRCEEDLAFRGQQFYLAVQATIRGITKKDEQYLTQRLIWRRCMLRDNWAELNKTDMKDDEEVNDQLRTTALYMTLRACYKKRIFEKSSAAKPIAPEHVLGVYTEELSTRFSRLDASIKDSLLKDMRAEDAALSKFIQKCQLGKWYQAALDLAKHDVMEEVNEETEDGEKMQRAAEKLKEIEKQISDSQKEKAESLLNSTQRYTPKRKVNGSLAKLRASSRF